MKKVSKSLVIVAIMAMFVLALTGCGANKLVATKTISESGLKYEEKMEFTFKNKKAENVTDTWTFDDEEMAKTLYEYMKEGDKDLDIKRDGKKVIIKDKAKNIASEYDLKEDELTKDNLKKKLEEKGYTVK